MFVNDILSFKRQINAKRTFGVLFLYIYVLCVWVFLRKDIRGVLLTTPAPKDTFPYQKWLKTIHRPNLIPLQDYTEMCHFVIPNSTELTKTQM